MQVRSPAVAGTFYPDDPGTLGRLVAQLLAGAPDGKGELHPKALIAPHAGYVYSGPIAASAYCLLRPYHHRIRRVLLLGPAHRVYLEGMAVPSTEAFSTPLGDVPLDVAAIDRICGLPGVIVSDQAHALEHSLEVQLPFLQALLDDFLLVPVVVGHYPSDGVAAVIDELWGGDETLVVVSSDLWHYHPDDIAQRSDAATTEAICARATAITGDQACGAYAINGLMCAVSERDLQVHVLDVRNSGDTAGDRSQVVGYGAYAVC